MRLPICRCENTAESRRGTSVSCSTAGEAAQDPLGIDAIARIKERESVVVVGDICSRGHFPQKRDRVLVPPFEHRGDAEDPKRFDWPLRIDLHRLSRFGFRERQEPEVRRRSAAIVVRQLEIGIDGHRARALVHHFVPVEFIVTIDRRKGLMRLAEIRRLARGLRGLLFGKRGPLRDVRFRCKPNSHLRRSVRQAGARERVRRIEFDRRFELAHRVLRSGAGEQQHRRAST